MFNVGGMEILLIGVVALVVLGPDKLPGAIRQVGAFVGQMRSLSQNLSDELRTAVRDAELDAGSGGSRPRQAAIGGRMDPRAVAAAELGELLGSSSGTGPEPPSPSARAEPTDERD